MSGFGNSIGVTYPAILWFQSMLSDHPKVSSFKRKDDVVFEVERNGLAPLRILLCNEYTFGMPQLYQFKEDFPEVNVFVVGGNWNRYDEESKKYCLEREIGLYTSKEIYRALFKPDFWNVYIRDKKGNKLYMDGMLQLD